MLIRRKFNIHKLPQLHGISQEVKLDPWESIECAEKIAEAFMQNEVSIFGWTKTAISNPVGRTLVLINKDHKNGYLYYHPEIDIERRKEWLKDKNFLVTADKW